MVYVETFGRPSGAARSVRCRVESDQVAVPSASGVGARPASAAIRARCLRAVGRPPAAAVAGRQRGEALGVEAGDEVGDGVAGAAADGAGRVLVVVAGGDGQEDLGPDDLGGRGGLRAAELDQFLPLRLGQLAERVLLAAGHGGLPGVQRPPIIPRSGRYGYRQAK